jgi:putative folate metabolism gamma-glutamate ligase
LRIHTHKTHAILPGESLFHLLDTYLPRQEEGSVVVITSKIVSLCEGRVVEANDTVCKRDLIRQSADAYLDDEAPFDIQLTITHNILIPSAGIDESNGNGSYILYPKNVQESALQIWNHLRRRDGLQQLGVIISDSHSTPLRRGVVGIGLGWCGFKPLFSYIGKPDCFNTPLKMTKVNVLDSLTSAAVFCMGEGSEQTPFATIEGVHNIEFEDSPPLPHDCEEFLVRMENDLYAPLLNSGNWVWNI